jgi:hypothetical protein
MGLKNPGYESQDSEKTYPGSGPRGTKALDPKSESAGTNHVKISVKTVAVQNWKGTEYRNDFFVN